MIFDAYVLTEVGNLPHLNSIIFVVQVGLKDNSLQLTLRNKMALQREEIEL